MATMHPVSSKDLDDVDYAIRQGKGRRAGSLLESLLRVGVPRAERARLAQLAWRLGRGEWGLKVLSPLVRGSSRTPAESSSSEKSEYAACLVRVGASDEAMRWLELADPEEEPRAHLYRAFAHISRWEYLEAIPHLKLYLRSPDLSSYQELVGLANLASAYVFERDFLRGTATLRELMHHTSAAQHHLLMARGLELLSIQAIEQGRLGNAARYLAKGEELLREHDGVDRFILDKWKAVHEFLSRKADAGGKRRLAALRDEAARRHHWETVRDCDFYLARETQDAELLDRVFAGTPYSRFRQQLLKQTKEWWSPPDQFLWRTKPEAKITLSLADGTLEQSGESVLKVGQVQHRLMAILAADLYRPFRSASLHDSLFPGEHFNPDSSPLRVRKSVQRLRDKLKASKSGIEVEEQGGEYRLQLRSGSALRIFLSASTGSRKQAQLEQLKGRFGHEPFPLESACEALGVSQRTVRRLLTDAVQDGRIARHVQGRATTYRFN